MKTEINSKHLHDSEQKDGDMTETLMESHNLSNGLVLEIFDESRKIAADRWQILIKTRIRIPVSDGLLGQDAEIIRKALGESAVFEKKEVRNFVDENQKDDIVKSICEAIKTYGHSYYAHPRFGSRYVLKAYREYEKAAIRNSRVSYE